MKKHSHNSRVAVFTVATNGSIMPSDDVFKTIRGIGAMIRISDYGKLSKCKDDIINKAKDYEIPCFIFPAAETWKRFGEYRKRYRSEEELKRISCECCFGTHDMMFVDDKIFCCLRALFSDAIEDNNDAVVANTFNLESEFSDDDLIDFFNGKNLWMMCDYCDYPMEEITPAEQI